MSAADVIVPTGVTHAIINPSSGRRHGVMRALTLVADRQLVIAQIPAPPPPRADEVQIEVKAVALNHIDVWGYRGMAFAKRKLPLVVGAEASGEIATVGEDVTRFKPGQKVAMYGALTCGICPACKQGRDNLCEDVAGIMGFHVDGFAREFINLAERLVIPVPDGVSQLHAACAPMRNIAESLDKIAGGMHPVIDTEVPIEDVATALKRMESRQVFGKIVVGF